MGCVDSFCEALFALCKEHGVMLLGNIRVTHMDGAWMRDSYALCSEESVAVFCHNGIPVMDRCGPFLVGTCERAEEVPEGFARARSFTLIDREKLMGDGVESPLDGAVYTRRIDYDGHLKRHGCHVVEDTASRRAEKRAQERTRKREEYQWALTRTREYMEGRRD